jgi:hypothetical protein
LTANRSWWTDFLIITAVATILIWPIFRTKYYENWTSIDATFIADGRFLSENLPHPGYQPLWYGGTRFDYVYPPALRYGTAILCKVFPIIPAKAYHLYTAIFYALGIGFVYLLARIGSGARVYSIFCAAGAALLSPSFLFLHHIRDDVRPYMPHRLNVLVRYGEGPHMTAFALLPLGLALAWRGLRPGGTRWLAGSAIAFALVVSNNFYGATALALFFPVLCWAVYAETKDRRVWVRGALTALLSYALCAAWLTPAYIKITARNLSLVSQPGNWWSAVLLVVCLSAFCLASWRMARKGISAWLIFLTGSGLIFCLTCLGNHFFNFRVFGEPARLLPELDLCLNLLVLYGLYSGWTRWPDKERGSAVAAATVIFFMPCWPYLERPWLPMVRTSEYKHRLEYQIAEWTAMNRPGTRSYVTGTVRFWWNAWFNEAQIGGGSEQGLTNITTMNMFWKMVIGNDPAVDTRWMQAYGVDNLVVNDKTSVLPYADFEHPQKYIDVLPVLWQDGKGNWIYEIPRKHRGLARVVEAARYARLKAPESGDDLEALDPYVEMLEKSAAEKAETRWLRPDTLEVRAETRAGQALAIQVAYDPYWRARENGREFPVSEDPFGQMRVDVPPGTHTLRMHFDTPIDNQIGRVVSAAALLLAIGLLLKRTG